MLRSTQLSQSDLSTAAWSFECRDASLKSGPILRLGDSSHSRVRLLMSRPRRYAVSATNSSQIAVLGFEYSNQDEKSVKIFAMSINISIGLPLNSRVGLRISRHLKPLAPVKNSCVELRMPRLGQPRQSLDPDLINSRTGLRVPWTTERSASRIPRRAHQQPRGASSAATCCQGAINSCVELRMPRHDAPPFPRDRATSSQQLRGASSTTTRRVSAERFHFRHISTAAWSFEYHDSRSV